MSSFATPKDLTDVTTHLLRHFHIHCDISVERLRQERLKAAGKFDATCADDIPNGARFLILGEEVGEVARAVMESPSRLRDELIQTAAVCFAWIERIDADAGRNRRLSDFVDTINLSNYEGPRRELASSLSTQSDGEVEAPTAAVSDPRWEAGE